MTLRETFISEGNYEQLSCEDHPRLHIFRREIGESRNKEMKMLFDSGLGIHHAGMLRSDRNLMEKMFAEKAIKVSDLVRRFIHFSRLDRFCVVLQH